MRKRTVKRMDRHTGEETREVTILPAAKTLDQRFKELQEATGDGVGVRVGMWVICNACGHREPVERPELPPGWVTRNGNDFCPLCTTSEAIPGADQQALDETWDELKERASDA